MSERTAASGYPENFNPILWEGFVGGLQTKTPRPGIKNEELSLCDGWFPLAPNCLRTLPGIGANIYTGGNVVWFGFGNISDNRYCAILRRDGSVVAVPATGGSPVTILAPGTIISPDSAQIGFSQWGSLYLLFCAPQNNGYWLWDGTNTFTAGTASPIVDISDGGSGYGSPPTVNAHGGTGSGIVLAAQLDNGAVSQVTVTSPGSGYSLNDQVVLTFNGSGTRTAIGTAVLTNGVITSVTLIDGGQGYQSGTGVQQPPTVNITDGTGSGASIIVNGMSGGIITSLQIVSGGSNYSAPTLSFSGSGSGGAAQAYVQNGVITGFTLTDGGAGYQSTPTVTFVSATGAGAAAKATIGAGGAVTQVQITAGGSGYTGTVWGTFVGGNGPAVATIEMMPFGISGTWIENYAGHVWIGNGAASAIFPPQGRVIFSSAGSPVNFGDSGGAFLDTNSFARVGYHAGKQTNGFLYLIADSSLDYISGVMTSTPTGGSSATTTFNNQNADPQIGSPWPSSVQVFSRNIVYANTVGVYTSVGGAVTKVSEALDGFYASSPAIFAGGSNFSSAVANIYGSQVYMLLLPIVDPVTGSAVNKLLMWDGKKWFTSNQDVPLTFIAGAEYNSILTAYGTDGTNIFPIFTNASTGFTKTVQSKLYAAPGYWSIKTSLTLHAVLQTNNTSSSTVNVSIDNETTLGSAGAAVSIPGSASPSLNVFNVPGPIPAGQYGYFLGLTAQTLAADTTIMSMAVIAQDYASNP